MSPQLQPSLNDRRSLKRLALSLGATGLLVASFYAGVAHAADPRLDLADDSIEKAILLLKAAQDPNATPPFGGHREKAIAHLERARKEIAAAKVYADNPK
jgi:hypothetical protein